MDKSKILITGGTGMVGKHLKQFLPEAVYVGSKDYDLRNILEVENLFKTYNPICVVHLAAKVGGIQDNINKPAEYFDDNIFINTNVLKISKKYNVDKFVGILSTCIYPDKASEYPMSENDLFKGPPAPTNFSYGYAKRCLAVQINAYNKQYGTKWNYLIPCNLYSEFDNFEHGAKMHFITALLKKIKTSKNSLELLGDGTPLRQFMYAGDLAKIIKKVIDNNITDSFNVAPPENLSIDQMAKISLKTLGLNLKINYSNPKLNGQFRKDVSSAKLNSILPNFNFTPFKQGIKKVYDKIS